MKRIFMHKTYGPIVISVLSAALITLFVGVLDIAHRPDRWVEDALYQHPHALDGKIIVIGIDDRALEEIGRTGDSKRDTCSGSGKSVTWRKTVRYRRSVC